MKIIDQQSDKSKTKLYSALGDMTNSNLQSKLKGMTFDPASIKDAKAADFALSEEQMFPINNKQNAILSRVYLDMQRDTLPEATIKSIGAKINRNLKLYGVPGNTFTYKEVTASNNQENNSVKPRYMLPAIEFCKVADTVGLSKAEALFDRGYSSLKLADRVCFAQNLVKAASELKAPITSDCIKKYAGLLDSDTMNVQYLLDMRAALAKRRGTDGSTYLKLAESLDFAEIPPTNTELTKLAELIQELDQSFGIKESDYNKVPCPYTTVFNKAAMDGDMEDKEQDQDPLTKLTKPEVVAQYGEDALAQVETEDGSIDIDKLKHIEKVKKAYA